MLTHEELRIRFNSAAHGHPTVFFCYNYHYAVKVVPNMGRESDLRHRADFLCDSTDGKNGDEQGGDDMMQKTRRRLLIAALSMAAISGAAAWATTVRAQSVAGLSVYPETVTAAEEDFVELGVYLSGGVMSLMGFDIEVTFDPTVIGILSVTEGPLPAQSGYDTFMCWMNPAAAGSVHVEGAILGNTVAGPGVLISLVFQALESVEDSETNVIISSSEMRNGSNQSIPHTTVDGEVKVTVRVPVEPSTWGSIKSLYD